MNRCAMDEQEQIELFRRTLEFTHWCKVTLERYQSEGKDTFGPCLGLNDSQTEEILLLEMYPILKELEMAIRSDVDLYIEARNRALERLVEGREFEAEVIQALKQGLVVAEDNTSVIPPVLTETNHGFAFILGVLTRLEAKKGRSYGASWIKRGERDGALANVSRKHDRIAEIVTQDSPGESLTTTLADCAVYCIKWAARRAETHPEEFLDWLKEVQNL
jgi:hypothetical protein